MGVFLAALAAAGDAGVQSMNQNIEQQNRSDLEDQRNRNESARDINRFDLEKQKLDYIESIKNAPLQRLGIIAKAKMQEDIPQEAAPVTQLNGKDPNSDFNQGNSSNADGMGLDPSKTPDLIARVNAMPDSDPNKAGIMEQLKGQLEAQKQQAIDNVKGQTRKRTSDEAMNAAMSDAKLSDPLAYMAGKGLVQDKFMQVGAGGAVIDTTTGKTLFQNPAYENKALIQAESRLAVMQQRGEDNKDIQEMKNEVAALKQGSASKMQQDIDALSKFGLSQDEIKTHILNRKSASVEDIATKILANDFTGKMTPSKAATQASDLLAEVAKLKGNSNSTAPSNSVTYNGKSSSYDSVPTGGLFTDPNGITRIKGGK